MKLVYVDENEPVQIGDIVLTNRSEEYTIIEIHPPKQTGAKGLITVADSSNNSRQFEPSVVKADWASVLIERPTENLRLAMKNVQEQIYNQKYFIERYEIILIRQKMTKENIELMHYPQGRCIKLAHYFWEALPDSASARRPPFSNLCNIAEYIFD